MKRLDLTVPRLGLAACVALGAIAAFGIWGVVGGTTAHAQDGHEHDPSDLAHYKEFTLPAGEIDWPPRPIGAGTLHDAMKVATGAIGNPDEPNSISLDETEEAAVLDSAPGARFDFALLAALGDEFTLISHAEAREGKYDSIGERWTWFSRSTNQTIIAELGSERRVGIEVLPATLMQPILSRPERDWAAEIGMEWLLNNGFPEAAGLHGTAIRALDDGKFYDVRMAYVTYATDDFADPTHSVLVDLTNLAAVSGRSL